jgi:mannose-6-phosphate isomerase-like protein (cupin superfamily)
VDYQLFFGCIHPDKGAKEAIARADGLKLIIAGVIQDESYYEFEVEPHLGADVDYVGSVGPEQRNALLHPINFNEPFGLSVVEAMSCGTPVIAFNRGSMPELIRPGLNGYLVADVEEASAAVKEIPRINRAACRKFVEENFSTARMVDDYIKVYEQIIARTKREDHRPWRYYTVLADEPDHKVKRIHVYAGKRLSLQKHRHRSEHWTMVYGEGFVTLDGRRIRMKKGEFIDIPKGAVHRMENQTNENMAFVEVQLGDYFGEDDIVRLEDDFGRAMGLDINKSSFSQSANSNDLFISNPIAEASYARSSSAAV